MSKNPMALFTALKPRPVILEREAPLLGPRQPARRHSPYKGLDLVDLPPCFVLVVLLNDLERPEAGCFVAISNSSTEPTSKWYSTGHPTGWLAYAAIPMKVERIPHRVSLFTARWPFVDELRNELDAPMPGSAPVITEGVLRDGERPQCRWIGAHRDHVLARLVDAAKADRKLSWIKVHNPACDVGPAIYLSEALETGWVKHGSAAKRKLRERLHKQQTCTPHVLDQFAAWEIENPPPEQKGLQTLENKLGEAIRQNKAAKAKRSEWTRIARAEALATAEDFFASRPNVGAKLLRSSK